jgi:hypothetical protein
LLAHGRWFSPGTLTSSTTKTGCHDIAEILLKVALSTINQWGYDFLFRSEFFFRSSREIEYLFFLSRKARNFLPEFNIKLCDKNSESDYFFFLHQNQNIFSATLGYQIQCAQHVSGLTFIR